MRGACSGAASRRSRRRLKLGHETARERRTRAHERRHRAPRRASGDDIRDHCARAGLVAIDARAAARPELGGVERWARELSARLPALRPGGYAVLRPPRALAHRAGHAWEQAALPLRAAQLGVAALLCPANLAPLAFARNVVVIHDAAPLRHPGWYSRAYAAWQRRAAAADRAPRAARDHPVRVLARASCASCSASSG